MSFSSSPGSSGDEGSEIMGRNAYPTRAQPKRVELDMSAIMNMEQKNALQLLINSILEDMQKDQRDVFDNLGAGYDESEEGIKTPQVICCTIPNPRSAKYQDLLADKENSTENHGRADQLAPSICAYTFAPCLNLSYIPRSVEEAIRMSGKTISEARISSLSDLKRDALGFFGKWRAAVQRRVGDMVIKGGGTAGLPVSQGPQQPMNAIRRPTRAPPEKAARKTIGEQSPQAGHLRSLNTNNSVVQASNDPVPQFNPAEPTSLCNLPKEKRAIMLHSIMLLLLGCESYASYSRCLLVHLANALKVPAQVLVQDEARLAGGLAQVVKGIPPEVIIQKRAEQGRSTRRNKGPQNNTNVGVNASCNESTGTLATPLMAAGIGSVFGGLIGLGSATTVSLLGSMADNMVAVGSLFGIYGGRPGGKTMNLFAKDIQDFAMLPLHGPANSDITDPKDVAPENRRLRVTIGISGWRTQDCDSVTTPWKVLGSQNETYALRLEVETMENVGTALSELVKCAGWSHAKQEIAARARNEHPCIPLTEQTKGFPVFASLGHCLWPADLLKASKIIDNPWCVGAVRAEKAGLVLAEALVNKVQGERGVTLIGYSLGARVIYACLAALAEKRHFGLVENVVLMGAPCPSEIRVWAAVRSVVMGRLVNVYSKNDYLLGFLCRSTSWTYGLAGLQKIQGVTGVENLDVSDILKSHDHYRYLAGSILKQLSWDDINYEQVARDEAALAQIMAKQHKVDRQRTANAAAAELKAQMARVALEESARFAASPRKKENKRGGWRKGRGKPKK